LEPRPLLPAHRPQLPLLQARSLHPAQPCLPHRLRREALRPRRVLPSQARLRVRARAKRTLRRVRLLHLMRPALLRHRLRPSGKAASERGTAVARNVFHSKLTDRFFGVLTAKSFLRYILFASWPVICLTILSLTGCDAGDKRADLVILNGAEPESIDPAVITGQLDGRICYALFDGLLHFDRFGKPRPAIAERWDLSSDGKTYTFHLRSDAKWSNGD